MTDTAIAKKSKRKALVHASKKQARMEQMLAEGLDTSLVDVTSSRPIAFATGQPLPALVRDSYNAVEHVTSREDVLGVMGAVTMASGFGLCLIAGIREMAIYHFNFHVMFAPNMTPSPTENLISGIAFGVLGLSFATGLPLAMFFGTYRERLLERFLKNRARQRLLDWMRASYAIQPREDDIDMLTQLATHGMYGRQKFTATTGDEYELQNAKNDRGVIVTAQPSKAVAMASKKSLTAAQAPNLPPAVATLWQEGQGLVARLGAKTGLTPEQAYEVDRGAEVIARVEQMAVGLAALDNRAKVTTGHEELLGALTIAVTRLRRVAEQAEDSLVEATRALHHFMRDVDGVGLAGNEPAPR